MITYLTGFKKKRWEDMTPTERIAVSNRKKEVMSDPETREVHSILNSFYREEWIEREKKAEKMQKLRQFLIQKKLKSSK
jgi:hypothetical protein